MLLPPERVLGTGAPATQRYWGSIEPGQEMALARLVSRNRERELGLDRRETG